tara:strand:+ start:1506 stop:2417 length:912 start_codon:yes stop_codon:yes gene_type:complete
METIFLALKSPGPNILNIGPLVLRWYGLLIAISILIGLNLSNKLAKRKGLPKRLINDLMPILVFSSIFGARIYYVFFEWRNYSGLNFWGHIDILGFNFPIPSAFEIWGGGIAIHGALIAGTISVILFCKRKKQNYLNVLDVLIPSVALGQAIGRWGNFFNNEAFGIPTSMPWKLFIPITNRPIMFINEQYFHPTFLYESIWNIFTFLILIALFRLGIKSKLDFSPGVLTFTYIIMYSFGRFWIEGLRIDPLCINSIPPFCEGGFRAAQLISILLMCIGVLGLSWINKKRKKRNPNQLKPKQKI